MSRRVLAVAGALSVCILLLSGSVFGRAALEVGGGRGPNQPMAAQTPAYCVAMHNVGQLVLAVNNNGTFATGFTQGPESDCFTGAAVPAGGGEYPKGSGVQYCFAASFWVGAVVGRDTLVSQGSDGWFDIREMFPDVSPFGDMKKRSIIDPSAPEYEGAISEQDYIAVYTDTFRTLADADEGGRQHIPLNIEVTQNSYAWSYSYAEDLVLFDYQIRNIGTQRLRNVYMGVYVDADVTGTPDQGFDDDVCGFRQIQERNYSGCIFPDTVNIAWIADNDGDFDGGAVEAKPTPAVTATRIVRTPADTLDVSFNWWISNGDPTLDFGPRERPFKGRLDDDYRDFGTGGTGTPTGDRNRYYSLQNREFDYDQVFTAQIGPNDTLWLEPPASLASTFAVGYDTRYLLSFGPFDISPGQKLPLSFSYLAGNNFHVDPDNAGANLPDNPAQYYENLDFSDLGLNSTWASWIYDNPGVDTDSNGYRGKYRLKITDPETAAIRCVDWDSVGLVSITPTEKADTIWFEGDGIPDFRGASPPPAPEISVEPGLGSIRVIFNGFRSETTKDVFSNLYDFEGYRVYIARDNRSSSYSLLTSYDREDYNKYVYDAVSNEWNLYDVPFTLEELRDIYNDPELDPLAWTRSRPYVPEASPDSQFYFTMQDYNASDLTDARGIHKVYPEATYPSSLNPDEADPSELTPEGRFKYFEYEYIIDSLLPTVEFYVNVTAFDYGSPASGLPSLETAKSLGAESTFPVVADGSGEVGVGIGHVVVYPNPYRIDGDYRGLGFEGRNYPDRPDDRVRAINFANLPPKCTIRIFTLDGDLVREISHDVPASDPKYTHDSWDLITRNTQMVVSGLYYWTVEDDGGQVQIGKLAIIM